MSEQLWQVYNRLDPVSLNATLTQVNSWALLSLMPFHHFVLSNVLFGYLLFVHYVLFQDLVAFEKQWSCFFSTMEQENHLSILELSEAQAGEVCHPVASAFYFCTSWYSHAIPLHCFGLVSGFD